MVSGNRDNPPNRQLYRAFICENVLPVGDSKLTLHDYSYPLLNN